MRFFASPPDIAPQSVLNARDGVWQERKRLWIALGIKSEIGRGADLTYSGEAITTQNLNFYRNREKQRAKNGKR